MIVARNAGAMTDAEPEDAVNLLGAFLGSNEHFLDGSSSHSHVGPPPLPRTLDSPESYQPE